MTRSPIVWLLVGGLPGLLAWWLLYHASGPARRGLLAATGVLAGGLLLVTAAGYAAAQVAPSPPEGEPSPLPGIVFLAGAAAALGLAAVAGLWAWRRARRGKPPASPSPQQQEEPGRDAPAPTSQHGQAATPPRPPTPHQTTLTTTTITRRVVVRGCSPQSTATLEGELQGVAEALGRHLVVLVSPRGPRADAFLHGETLVVQVRRPQLSLVAQAIFTALGNGAQGQQPRGRPLPPSATPAPRRLRHDDLAAAVGEGASKGEG